MPRPYLLLLTFLAFLCFSPRANGQTPSGAPAEALGLVVFGDPLPQEELRAGLERELGRPVVLRDPAGRAAGPFVTVTWKKERSELAVSYDEPGRGTVSR